MKNENKTTPRLVEHRVTWPWPLLQYISVCGVLEDTGTRNPRDELFEKNSEASKKVERLKAVHEDEARAKSCCHAAMPMPSADMISPWVRRPERETSEQCGRRRYSQKKLELELTQTKMTKNPVLWVAGKDRCGYTASQTDDSGLQEQGYERERGGCRGKRAEGEQGGGGGAVQGTVARERRQRRNCKRFWKQENKQFD